MNLSLRNLAMGAALAVSSFAFAQEMPFTVTENYNRLLTGADFGVSALGGDIRTATGVNGKSYALDKGTGKIYAIDATTVTEYATVDVNRGEDSDHVMLDITSDDAGNLLVAYAAGDFFANSLKGVAIVPADGSDVIYVDELDFPDGWEAGRVDIMGRIVGDMLSEEGAYFYLTGAGGANKVACYWISEGAFEVQEYTSDEYKTAGASLTYAVPMYNTVAEQADVDPIYNGGVLFPWNANGPEMIVDGACVTLSRAEGLTYSSTPGGDVINYEGKMYYAIPYTTASGKRSGDFVITDETGAVYFKTTNGEEGGLMADLVATGSFVNGGGLYIHPVAGETGIYELYWWGGFNQGVICASYTITFPQPEKEAPFTVTNIYNRLLTGADFGVSALGGDIRTATGVKGHSYALDKGTGTIYAIDGTTVTEYAKVDVNRGDDNDHVMLDITSDDAGNLLVAYAKGDFFANSLKGVAIVPADGSDVIYVDELDFPDGWEAGRVDIMGRIVGDMLSEEGAYFYLTGAGGANKVACYWISEGAFEVQEYTSDEYKTAGASLTYAVPMYNTVAEQADVDPIYNGGVLFPWNAYGPEMIVDGECVTLPRAEGLAYSSTPGGDVLNYNGKMYYAVPYTTVSGKRSGDFVITDETGAVLFKTTNGEEGGLMADLVATGSFVNGGG
ncbi:MAG: hypothetical protein K2M00_02370, partial [Muribaculaceae bacterium]|nr:hypothetical protein [Muribaculaceae bacterium]